MISYKIFCDTDELRKLSSEYMKVVRMSFNIFKKNPGCKLSYVEQELKDRSQYNTDLIDSSFIKMAVNQSKSMRQHETVLFGNTSEFRKLKYKKSTANKEKYKRSRDFGMLLRGSSSDNCGNRKAKLDIQNNRVIVKPKSGTEHVISFKINDKRKKDLLRLQSACEANEAYFTLQINDGYICIVFDEKHIQAPAVKRIDCRILSMDLNPNYIGISIQDSEKNTIHKTVIDLYELNRKNISTSKKKHEKHQAIKRIFTLANHYKVSKIAIEDLTIKSKNHGKSKEFNRLNNNTWHRTLLVNGIKKWANIFQIQLVEVPAFYSSFIGCFYNPHEFDSVAAAIELNARARQKLAGKRVQILPLDKLTSSMLPTLWKEMVLASSLVTDVFSFKELFDLANKTKLSYRFRYDRNKVISFKLESSKSLVRLAKL